MIGRINIWQIKAIIKFLGFLTISKKSLVVKFKPSENMIKIIPIGPTFFTNSNFASEDL